MKTHFLYTCTNIMPNPNSLHSHSKAFMGYESGIVSCDDENNITGIDSDFFPSSTWKGKLTLNESLKIEAFFFKVGVSQLDLTFVERGGYYEEIRFDGDKPYLFARVFLTPISPELLEFPSILNRMVLRSNV